MLENGVEIVFDWVAICAKFPVLRSILSDVDVKAAVVKEYCPVASGSNTPALHIARAQASTMIWEKETKLLYLRLL